MKAIITIGVPCSGKSTWAEQYCKEVSAVEINRDNIRMSLFKLERYSDYKFSKDKEYLVSEYVQGMIKRCSDDKVDIIISDTNLNQGHRENLVKYLTELDYTVEFKLFDVEFFDLIKRNDKRTDKQIPRKVMYDMYRRFMDYKESIGLWKKHQKSVNKIDAYIVDIDGTLASNRGVRGWYDWESVGLDSPIMDVIDVVNDLYDKEYTIILLSGRDEICREQTINWLRLHGVMFDEIYMRPHGSMDKDRDVKYKLFMDHVESDYNVKGVFDDRLQVSLLWHDLGITLFKVGDPILEF